MWWVAFEDDANFWHGPFTSRQDAQFFGDDEVEFDKDCGYDNTFVIRESDGSPIVH